MRIGTTLIVNKYLLVTGSLMLTGDSVPPARTRPAKSQTWPDTFDQLPFKVSHRTKDMQHAMSGCVAEKSSGCTKMRGSPERFLARRR
jgi:hypothetical protein